MVKKQYSILIIEDEPHIRSVYKDALKKVYTLDFAVNGQEGFQKASQNDYDLVIADLTMPNWNGAEAIAALEITQPHLKFMIVSAYLHDSRYTDILKDMKSVVAQVDKPFDINELTEVIERAIRS